MNNPATYLRRARGPMAMGLALSCLVGCNKPAQPAAAAKLPASAKAVAPSSSTNSPATEYVSVFEDLLPPKGKDPFFPNSHRREPVQPPAVAAAAAAAKAPVAAVLALKGIIGSATRRLALINNEPMEPGETSSVRVPDGRVQVKCLEIGKDYVLIKVEGEDQPKRLEMEK